MGSIHVCTDFCTYSTHELDVSDLMWSTLIYVLFCTMIALFWLFFLKIEGKGNCFFEAVLFQLSFMDDEEGVELYKQYHIQCQMVAHVLNTWSCLNNG